MKVKNIIIKVLIAFMAMGVAVASVPVEVMVPIEDVYSPKGFDSNDNSQIIISGYLPNLCHRAPKSIVKMEQGKVDIKIVSLKYDPSNPYCPEMIVPFVEAIDLGVMDKGIYDIVVNGKSIYERKASLEVEEASSDAVDEFVYAGVEYIEKSAGSRRVVLKGYNPSDCFVLDEIDVMDNGRDVYSIMPKMKQISDFCALKMVPFEYDFIVPEKLKADKVLLHVRSVQGKSVNSIFLNANAR
jgi:hypothetical protein